MKLNLQNPKIKNWCHEFHVAIEITNLMINSTIYMMLIIMIVYIKLILKSQNVTDVRCIFLTSLSKIVTLTLLPLPFSVLATPKHIYREKSLSSFIGCQTKGYKKGTNISTQYHDIFV